MDDRRARTEDDRPPEAKRRQTVDLRAQYHPADEGGNSSSSGAGAQIPARDQSSVRVAASNSPCEQSSSLYPSLSSQQCHDGPSLPSPVPQQHEPRPVAAGSVEQREFTLDILNVGAEEVEGETIARPLASEWESWTAEDDVKGGPLPPQLVHEARVRELEYLQRRKVYEYSTVAEALRLTGKQPLNLKWIDSNKGGKTTMNIRARLVATEVRKRGVDSIFCATPPLESLRALVAQLTSECPDGQADPWRVALGDVSRAHFYADAVRDVFIRLPREDPRSSMPGACGKLGKTMYGTLDAGAQWSLHYTRILLAAGFQQGTASPCHFFHPTRMIWLIVHGDDFFTVSKADGLEYVRTTLEKEYEMKWETAGPAPDDAKQLRVLGRILTFHPWGVSLEGDPALVEAAVDKLGLNSAKGISSPGVSPESIVSACEIRMRRMVADPMKLTLVPGELEEDGEELSGNELRQYQSSAALINYISLDRPDLMFSAKECMRAMARPHARHLIMVKRIARYLKTAPRWWARYAWEALPSTVDVYIDADHAGCVRTRRSTVGGALVWGSRFIKGWSKTMEILALSTAESELSAVVRGTAEGIGLQSVLKDFGVTVKLHLRSDATAAIGMARRLGLGRVRHLAVSDLWVQQRLKGPDISISKLPGLDNPSDLMTKYKDRSSSETFMGTLGFEAAKGRPHIAPCRTEGWTIDHPYVLHP